MGRAGRETRYTLLRPLRADEGDAVPAGAIEVGPARAACRRRSAQKDRIGVAVVAAALAVDLTEVVAARTHRRFDARPIPAPIVAATPGTVGHRRDDAGSRRTAHKRRAGRRIVRAIGGTEARHALPVAAERVQGAPRAARAAAAVRAADLAGALGPAALLAFAPFPRIGCRTRQKGSAQPRKQDRERAAARGGRGEGPDEPIEAGRVHGGVFLVTI